MAFDDYQIPTRAMTSDEVLTLLGEAIFDSPFLSIDDVTPDTPVNALLEAWDDPSLIATAEALNARFEIALPYHEWECVLAPPLTRPLGDVCDLIARHAKTAVVEPVTIFGDHSLAAGAFLAVRRILADAGTDVSDLRPSSPLTPYFREHVDAVVPRLQRLAPGRLHWPQVDEQIGTAAALGYLLGWVILLMGMCIDLPWQIQLAGGVSMLLFWCMGKLSGRYVKPLDVRFGDTRTFRDLARIITGERCAFPGFPVVVR